MKQILTEPQPAKAVFFDRDGVLNRAIVRNGKPYPPQSLADFSITPDAPGSVADLFRAGFRLFVVTNQPDVARGNQTRAAVENMHDALRRELPIEEIFTCWHDDAAGCDCRKPRPGLILTAKAKYGIDLTRSFLIGDRWRDVEAGHRVGCRTVFIDYKYNEPPPKVEPDATTASLREAVDWILRHEANPVRFSHRQGWAEQK